MAQNPATLSCPRPRMITRPQNPSAFVLLFSLKGSIITAIWRKVLFTVLISSVVVATHGTLYHYKVVLTATPFTLWGLTLAICLGFRNTVAYQRFWEARTLWGELSIVTRNLTRQLLTLLPNAGEKERRYLLDLLIAFAYTLKDHLRRAAPSEELYRLLDESTRYSIALRQNPPSAVLHELAERMAELARESGASDMVQVHLDEQLTRMNYVLGGCERIKNTPIPYPYILMLHRIVHLYCFLLPFCLVDSIGWFTPFAVCVLAYTFFGLDALGDQIADPFDTQPNDLPLDAMCRGNEIAVLEMLGEEAPAAMEPVNGVLL
jgi:putative membrane protein